MKRQKKQTSKRRSNPLTNRNRPSRPKVAFDGQVLEGFTYLAAVTTGSDGAGTQAMKVDCASDGIASSLSTLLGYYKEYWFEMLKLEWIPSISPANSLAGSQLYVTMDNNPEHMVQYLGGVASTNNGYQLNDANTRIINAWERVTLNMTLPKRRKTFDVNTANSNAVDVLDRSTHSLCVLGYNTTTVSSSVGRWKASYRIRLLGLSNPALT